MHVGDIIYYYDEYQNIIVKAEIINLRDVIAFEKTILIAELRVMYAVDTNYEPTTIYNTHVSKKVSDLYKTGKAAYEAYKEKCNREVENYCKEISTLEDLLIFPLAHVICEDEWTDYEAVKAYKIRAKELTGIDLNEKRK